MYPPYRCPAPHDGSLYGAEPLAGPGAPLSAPYQYPPLSATAGAGTLAPASRISDASTPIRAGGAPRRLIRVARVVTVTHSLLAPGRTGDTESGPKGANRARTVNWPGTPRSPTLSAATGAPGRPVLGLKSR